MKYGEYEPCEEAVEFFDVNEKEESRNKSAAQTEDNPVVLYEEMSYNFV